MLGDPDQLDALAARLRTKAGEVRSLAEDHVRAGELAHWVSDSADVYRSRLVDDRMKAHAAADELDTAAALVNDQADAVRERLAAIAAAAAAAADAAKDAVGHVADKAGDLAEGARDIASEVGSGIADGVSDGLDFIFDGSGSDTPSHTD